MINSFLVGGFGEKKEIKAYDFKMYIEFCLLRNKVELGFG